MAEGRLDSVEIRFLLRWWGFGRFVFVGLRCLGGFSDYVVVGRGEVGRGFLSFFRFISV